MVALIRRCEDPEEIEAIVGPRIRNVDPGGKREGTCEVGDMAVIPNHQCRLIRRGHFACHLRLIAAPQMVQHGQPKTLRDPVGGQPGTITVVVGIRSRGIDATRFHQLIVVLTGV